MVAIRVWNKCNNNCLMCSNYFVRNIDDSKRTISNMVIRVKEKEPNPSEITFTGGEPFTNPGIFNIITKFRGLYPKTQINILSNGRIFSYLKYVQKLKKHFDDKMQISISLLGSNPQVHDSISGCSGSFKQTISGIKNLLKLGIPPELRVIILKQNFKHLREIANYILDNLRGVKYVVLIFVDFVGNVLNNKGKTVITYSETMPYLTEAMDILDKNQIHFRLYHFPLCVLPKKFWNKSWVSVEKSKTQNLSNCKECTYSKECVGVLKGYYSILGSKEFVKLEEENVIFSGNLYNPIKEVKNE